MAKHIYNSKTLAILNSKKQEIIDSLNKEGKVILVPSITEEVLFLGGVLNYIKEPEFIDFYDNGYFTLVNHKKYHDDWIKGTEKQKQIKKKWKKESVSILQGEIERFGIKFGLDLFYLDGEEIEEGDSPSYIKPGIKDFVSKETHSTFSGLYENLRNYYLYL